MSAAPAPGASPEAISSQIRDVLSELARRGIGGPGDPLGKRYQAALINLELLVELTATPPLPGWTSEVPKERGLYWLSGVLSTVDDPGPEPELLQVLSSGTVYCLHPRRWHGSVADITGGLWWGPLAAPAPRASAGEREG